MELETFECSHKVAYPSRDGGGKYSIYVTKEDGTDMTIYGEAIGAEGWAKGSKLRITAEPMRQSKNGKFYQGFSPNLFLRFCYNNDTIHYDNDSQSLSYYYYQSVFFN